MKLSTPACSSASANCDRFASKSFTRESIRQRDSVTVLDTQGNPLGDLEVLSVHQIKRSDRTLIVQVQAPKEYAKKIAGLRIQDQKVTEPLDEYVAELHNDTIICRCERVTVGEIRELIRKGVRDINEIKTVTRAGMGACGSKTCNSLIHRLFREEGITNSEVVDNTKRPLFMEVPIGVFAGETPSEDKSA